MADPIALLADAIAVCKSVAARGKGKGVLVADAKRATSVVAGIGDDDVVAIILKAQLGVTPMPGDASSPAEATGMLAVAQSSSSVRLTWTEHGDVGSSGLLYARIKEQAVSGVTAPSTDPVIDTIASGIGSYLVTGLAAQSGHDYYVELGDAAGNWSGPSNVGSETTEALSGGSGWAVNTATLPYLPGTAGHGSDTFGGTGRDAVSGGYAAAQNVWFVRNVAEEKLGLAATGRRSVIKVTSGIYDYGINQTCRIQNAGTLTWTDLSPSPGAVNKGGSIWQYAHSDVCLINIRMYHNADNATFISTGGGNCFALVQDGTPTVTRSWHAFCSFLYGYDQIASWTYKSSGNGSFATVYGNAIRNSAHPDGAHSTGWIGDYLGKTDNHSVLRCVFANNGGRNIMSSVAHLHYADNLVYNYADEALAFLQKTSPSSGYPMFSNVENNVFKAGLDDIAHRPIRIGSPGGYKLHVGSQIYAAGNRGIGTAGGDATQLAMCVYDGGATIPAALESSQIASAAAPGYNANPITDNAARVKLLTSTSGAWSAARTPQETALMAGIINGTGRIIDHVDRTYPTLAVSTSTFAADPPPGIASITPGVAIALGLAGRAIQPSGYSAFEEWQHRQLAARGIAA